MNYKYKRSQIFGKRLKVPKNILTKVYNKTLYFNEYIEYELEDKIPISCLIEQDRKIVEKFGLEKSKTLDWELLNTFSINARDILMSMPESTTNLNTTLYEIVKDRIKPYEYSTKMKEVYKDRLFEIPEGIDKNLENIMRNFNNGNISMPNIIRNWELLKGKDLSYCIKNDRSNVQNITQEQLKEFMSEYAGVSKLILKNIDIYSFIDNINKYTDKNDKINYIKQFTDNILSSTHYRRITELTNDEYKELFKYSSMEDYLKSINKYSSEKLIKELKTLPQDYIFNTNIPFNVIENFGVLQFIGLYGLKNIVEFDNECGHIFSKDNFELLKLMDKIYLQNSTYSYNPNRTIFTKKDYDDNGNYIDRQYTKDEFYEAMRRMITYGSLNNMYIDLLSNYKNITGEFRKKNPDLFISYDAPQELQDAFYTKQITPKLIREHKEYIPYLKGKNINCYFKVKDVEINNDNSYYFENFYQFISEKLDFDSLIDFIVEYSDILEIILNYNNDYISKISFSKNDNINEIKKKINNFFKYLIIEKGIVYPNNVPENIKENYPELFLDSSLPKELQDAFYNRKINLEFIKSHSEYIDYLRNLDIELLYKYMPTNIYDGNTYLDTSNLVRIIKQTFGNSDGFDVMLIYNKYLEDVYKAYNGLGNFRYYINFTKDDLLDEMDSCILNAINKGIIKYNEDIPSHFKNNNKELFLDSNVPQDIKDKFYNREFTLKDFEDNKDLIEIFNGTNIIYGFSQDIYWMASLFKDNDNNEIANYNRLKVISAYYNIKDFIIKENFKKYIIDNIENIEIEKIQYVSQVLSRLSMTNSNEIFTFRRELAEQILNSDNPIESLNKIEDVFIKNNIPTVGKIFSCFEILHPNFQGFDFNNPMMSPTLKGKSTMGKKMIVFSDLIKTTFGSNNRSIKSYLKNIEIGNVLYESIKSGQISYDELNSEQKLELITFSKHLSTLYNNSIKGRKDKEKFINSEDVISDILDLSKKISPNGSLDYNLSDRIIRMFCGFSGIDTLEDAKRYIDSKIKMADSRNRNMAYTQVKLEKGDFIKGIGDINYLKNILQNGSVSSEFLGSSAGSTNTPLDTDISMITKEDGTIEEKLNGTAAKSYGPIWFVLKNDDRFITTRTENGNLEVKDNNSKMEVFYTGFLGEGHYGIRTGFASSEINYMIVENYDEKIGLEIAMNGFYIPVVDKSGKIVFTPDDYDKLREKMEGLSYYDENTYKFSNNLVNSETINLAEQVEESNNETSKKREKINTVIKKSLEEVGLVLKTNIDGDLTEGVVEFIDTGSTGRKTNKPFEGDFDFMMRLDKNILSNPNKLSELKKVLLKNLGKENSNEIINTGDFRLKNVQLDDMIVDIDITFSEKTDKVNYSTDMALQDRLSTIEKIDKEKYKYVISNILLAKSVLKNSKVYKPNRGEIPQGGLGGVGIENWILQNGGSFIDAAKSFVKASEDRTFDEFKKIYKIWDFGENHLSEKRGLYPHDNFVECNMSEEGYKKMVTVLKEYLENYDYKQEDVNKISH